MLCEGILISGLLDVRLDIDKWLFSRTFMNFTFEPYCNVNEDSTNTLRPVVKFALIILICKEPSLNNIWQKPYNFQM